MDMYEGESKLRKNRLSLAQKIKNLAVAAAMMPMAVHAQGQVLEEVIVTGSRIHKTNVISASPVTQVDAEELLFQGVVRVEDMIKGLPQVYSSQNASQSNGATGTATPQPS